MVSADVRTASCPSEMMANVVEPMRAAKAAMPELARYCGARGHRQERMPREPRLARGAPTVLSSRAQAAAVCPPPLRHPATPRAHLASDEFGIQRLHHHLTAALFDSEAGVLVQATRIEVKLHAVEGEVVRIAGGTAGPLAVLRGRWGGTGAIGIVRWGPSGRWGQQWRRR